MTFSEGDYVPQIGDKVRVTFVHEAEVTGLDAQGASSLSHSDLISRTIEKIAPALPPEPAIGSVVCWGPGVVAARIKSWFFAGSEQSFAWPELMWSYGTGFRLLHDAGVSADTAHVRAAGNSEETRSPVAAVPVTPETPEQEHEADARELPNGWFEAWCICGYRSGGQFRQQLAAASIAHLHVKHPDVYRNDAERPQA